MVTNGIDQLLSNCEMYEHRFMGNIKRLYKYAGKYNDKLQFKAIIEA